MTMLIVGQTVRLAASDTARRPAMSGCPTQAVALWLSAKSDDSSALPTCAVEGPGPAREVARPASRAHQTMVDNQVGPQGRR